MTASEASEANDFDALVSADKMPPCPLCGKPLHVPMIYPAMPMVFFAHGLAALAHDSCHPEKARDRGH